MRLFERTKVYTLSEFKNLEARREFAEVDKQIGIWKRTNKKFYKLLVIMVACLLLANSFTVLTCNTELYGWLLEFTKYGIQIGVMVSMLFDILFNSKNCIEEMLKDAADGLTISIICVTFIKYVCSMIPFI